jgi:hypothetical protein
MARRVLQFISCPQCKFLPHPVRYIPNSASLNIQSVFFPYSDRPVWSKTLSKDLKVPLPFSLFDLSCLSLPPVLSALKCSVGGPGSAVGIATGYGLDGLGIESWWGVRFSAPVQTGPGAHPASCTMGTGSFPGVESGRGVTLTPHLLLVSRSKNRVELYLFSPEGPSWPIKG